MIFGLEIVVVCPEASHIHRPLVIGMALINTGISLKKKVKKSLENITNSIHHISRF